MTPEDLRKLADEATPGPWTKDPDSNAVWANFTRDEYMPGEFIDEGDLIVYDEGRPSKADARLIALAPDLAQLCAELGDAAQRYVSAGSMMGNLQDAAIAYDDLVAAVAKLSELEAPSAP